MSTGLNTERAVRERYSAAADQRESELCCPVDYNADYLKAIPQEVIDRDYGCGDPSKYVQPGETVLDLGSGGGKICFIASQVVGASGKVIGVDMNDTMLRLARESQPKVAQAIGYDVVEFHKGKIQDLAIDRDVVDAYLSDNPVSDEAGLQRLESVIAEMRTDRPMIADNSIDVVVSNCVLNLVDASEKAKLFNEIFRVLRPGGRAVISDIVCDQPVPVAMRRDAELWSGCISGAFEEAEFINAFVRAGFHGVEMAVLQPQPWRTVEGIEFRSATVIAYKDASQPVAVPSLGCLIYRGPFRQVTDDFGNVFERGIRQSVNSETMQRMSEPPYDRSFIRLTAGAKPSGAGLTIIGDDRCGTAGCC